MRDTVRVAEDLLGCFLLRNLHGGQKLVGRIVETEAYLGIKDPSCHSFKGLRTKRTKTMYLPGGYSYIYFTYGMYHCFNVVTAKAEEPEAVLIRAVQPLKGLLKMQNNRQQEKIEKLCSGPGKLCQAFNITKSLNAKILFQKGELYISKGEKERNVETDCRVGLPQHKDSSFWFLRFYVKNSPFVSLKKRLIG